ncbi:hypothetical protein C1I60_00475 [Paenibacillus terrae]|uniref:Uncharacterized protein n=1 Tax=Paenibacillus terrae TaxID=159743 RepID=A0A4U2Q5K1_9BACL|nr:hypothetical protein C1I60_00475 [Paenibacillus terrae]
MLYPAELLGQNVFRKTLCIQRIDYYITSMFTVTSIFFIRTVNRLQKESFGRCQGIMYKRPCYEGGVCP